MKSNFLFEGNQENYYVDMQLNNTTKIELPCF